MFDRDQKKSGRLTTSTPVSHLAAAVGNAAALQMLNEPEPRANHTGIPDSMKQQFERSSGLAFDDVKVHYNSDKPSRLQALAYTQGSSVYLGPGQERHLPHELGHVVQQKQHRVKPTGNLQGMAVNTSPALEQEADAIAARNK